MKQRVPAPSSPEMGILWKLILMDMARVPESERVTVAEQPHSTSFLLSLEEMPGTKSEQSLSLLGMWVLYITTGIPLPVKKHIKTYHLKGQLNFLDQNDTAL